MGAWIDTQGGVFMIWLGRLRFEWRIGRVAPRLFVQPKPRPQPLPTLADRIRAADQADFHVE